MSQPVSRCILEGVEGTEHYCGVIRPESARGAMHS